MIFGEKVLYVNNKGFSRSPKFFEITKHDNGNGAFTKKEIENNYDSLLDELKDSFEFEELVIFISIFTHYLYHTYKLRGDKHFIANKSSKGLNESYILAKNILNMGLIGANILLARSARSNKTIDADYFDSTAKKVDSLWEKVVKLGKASSSFDLINSSKTKNIEKTIKDNYSRISEENQFYGNNVLKEIIDEQKMISLFEDVSRINYNAIQAILDNIKTSVFDGKKDYDFVLLNEEQYLKWLIPKSDDPKWKIALDKLTLKVNGEQNFRISKNENYPGIKPIIQFGDKYFISFSLVASCANQYLTLIYKGNSEYKILDDKTLLNYKEKFIAISKEAHLKFYINVFEAHGFKIDGEEIKYSSWKSFDDKKDLTDLGDIDIVFLDDKNKVVCFCEEKFKAHPFFNFTNTIKTEEEWVDRQVQRLSEFELYAKRKYPGYKWFCPLLTNTPISMGSTSEYIRMINPHNIGNEILKMQKQNKTPS